MGKNKKLKVYKRFADNAYEAAVSAHKCAMEIIGSWGPEKRKTGLSKKESRAAYVGFAIGLLNGADLVMRGNRVKCNRLLREFVYEKVSDIVHDSDCAEGADDDSLEDVAPKVVEGELVGLREFIEALFGSDEEA